MTLRHSHIKRIFGTSVDADGNETEDKGSWIDIERIDRFTRIVNAGGQRVVEILRWRDAPDDEPNSTRVTETVKLIPPSEDQDNPSLYFKVEVPKRVRINISGQIARRILKTTSDVTRRRTKAKRVKHFDLESEIEDRLNDGEIIPVDDYNNAKVTDSTVDSEYIDMKFVDRMPWLGNPDAQGATSIFKNEDPEDLLDDAPDDADPPPKMLDPYQIVRNVGFGAQFVMIGFPGTDGAVVRVFTGNGSVVMSSTYLPMSFDSNHLENACCLDSKGHAIVAFTSTGPPHTAGPGGDQKTVVAKLSLDGKSTVWEKTIIANEFMDLKVGPDDDVYYVGAYNPHDGGADTLGLWRLKSDTGAVISSALPWTYLGQPLEGDESVFWTTCAVSPKGLVMVPEGRAKYGLRSVLVLYSGIQSTLDYPDPVSVLDQGFPGPGADPEPFDTPLSQLGAYGIAADALEYFYHGNIYGDIYNPYDPTTSPSHFLHKITSSGTPVWSKRIPPLGGSYQGDMISIDVNKDGSRVYIIAALSRWNKYPNPDFPGPDPDNPNFQYIYRLESPSKSEIPNSFPEDFAVACFDDNGNHVWSFTGLFPSYYHACVADTDGMIYLSDNSIIKRDADTGKILWTTDHGAAALSVGRKLYKSMLPPT